MYTSDPWEALTLYTLRPLRSPSRHETCPGFISGRALCRLLPWRSLKLQMHHVWNDGMVCRAFGYKAVVRNAAHFMSSWDVTACSTKRVRLIHVTRVKHRNSSKQCAIRLVLRLRTGGYSSLSASSRFQHMVLDDPEHSL